MKKTVRRSLKSWLACAVIVPILAACAVGSEDRVPDEGRGVAVDGLDATANGMAVKLSAAKASLGPSEGFSVTVTWTNGTQRSLRLLKWNTLVDGIREPLFVVTRDGAAVEYIGRHYKRGAPRPQDYVVLEPGESLTNTVDLAEAYDLSVSGQYAVHFAEGAELVSNEVSTWVEGRPWALDEGESDEATALAADIKFSGGCKSGEKDKLRTAMKDAASHASKAASYLNGSAGSKPRYTTWFGSYKASRWDTAQSHFKKIKDALANKDYTLDCGCNEDNVYAYVYKNKPYKIYLCDAFWSAPAKGTDSKAGVMIHETSHFDVVASTEDHAYGQGDCKKLADDNPGKALDNADSHEYFAENTPSQN
ncbi:M35 family metallo-endopeptidase [Pendulispora brunnea]|uniref:M35 family metallo-endopeptidase n=1 Tax=Pendulispora brunnea TaxID=2905690 RepID=A0ABZ2JYI8_9BACT